MLLLDELADFREFGSPTQVAAGDPPVLVNEFWTSRQRAAHSLHEVSYRACFKPQLPRFFIERLTRPGQVVYDPFLGRGTTALEAALMGRVALGCDINPLSRVLLAPRLRPPTLLQVRERLDALDLSYEGPLREDLLVFYHPGTLREIHALRRVEDEWLRMVAVNRLTGHSPGFFSVYTMPPNQAVSVESQRKINQRRGQTPPYRDTRELIWRKSVSLLRDPFAGGPGSIYVGSCLSRPEIAAASVDLVVTSPPFLDVVQYREDNWLRCWFCGIDPGAVEMALHRRVEDWARFIGQVFAELARVLKPGGHVAFEVGEVRNGRLKLEDLVLPAGRAAGLEPLLVLINQQEFTKTANCWGVSNGAKGTNTNRVVLFRK